MTYALHRRGGGTFGQTEREAGMKQKLLIQVRIELLHNLRSKTFKSFCFSRVELGPSLPTELVFSIIISQNPEGDLSPCSPEHFHSFTFHLMYLLFDTVKFSYTERKKNL